jgi:hypothetical protein
MQGNVSPPPDGTGFSAKFVDDAGKLSVNVTVPPYFFFAARVMGGGALTPMTSALNLTANCTAQVFQITAANTIVTHTIRISEASKDVYVAIGFTDGSYGPGLFVINSTSP